MTERNLEFIVAPHIVQDLGINLYTTLPRVLVEFVANAHDADSPDVDVQIDFDAIQHARDELRKSHAGESGRLEDVELPNTCFLKIVDTGHGMSRSEVQNRFLVAGRRRRREDNSMRSPGRRILMGRKGLGKLAGFGVAKRVTVTSRKKGEDYATRVVLDYDALVTSNADGQIPVPTETIESNLPSPGTEITLDRLVFEPVKSKRSTIEKALANHFRFVGIEDFEISINGEPIQPAEAVYAFEWPSAENPPEGLCPAQVQAGDGHRQIKYRVRFTKKSLPARERGVRIYASGRLASTPDLLDMPTGMHGFRLTDYIDAVAVADFIDQESTEYIATDRRSLRWETFFLQGLREFLSQEMKAAVTAYQKLRDSEATKLVREDLNTIRIIDDARLSSQRRKVAEKLAGELAKIFPEGVSDPEYVRNLHILANGLGHGTVLESLAELSRADLPGFNALSEAVLDLAVRETGELARFAEGRINAIESLKKIVGDVDFKEKNEEQKLQQLLEKAPWLIDPVFTQAVTADKWVSTTFERLAKFLGIREFATKPDQTRADLVFLVSTTGGSEVTIVELKAANTSLNGDHLVQLEKYISKAEKFLAENKKGNIQVYGILIGSRDPDSTSENVEYLNSRIKKDESSSNWQVKTILEVLERAELAHKELIEIYQTIESAKSK